MKSFLYLFIVFCVLSCATPGTPMGGPKDETPPTATDFAPAQKALNFNGKNLVITFDEFISINNPQQEVIISPPIIPFPDFLAKRNELIIKIKDTLRKETTYQIAFGNSLKDVNEGNPANNVRWVFSTGSVIDSLSLSGKVTSLDGDKIPENTFVQLYADFTDSTVLSKKPDYIYKLGSDGSFVFENLPHGQFTVIALSDKNNNYFYDLPNESIGKLNEQITLDSNISKIVLPIFLPENPDLKLKEYNTQLDNGIFQVQFNRWVIPNQDNITLSVLNDSGSVFSFKNDFPNDKLRFYVDADSFPVQCVLKQDTLVLDTLTLRKSSKPPLPGILSSGSSTILQGKKILAFPGKPIQLRFSLPIASIDTSKLILEDTSGNLQSVHFHINNEYCEIQIDSLKPSNIVYQLLIGTNAINFNNGTQYAADTLNIQTLEAKQLGSFQANLSFPKEGNYVVFVRDKDGRFVAQSKVNGDSWVYYSGAVMAGTFIVEVVEDVNNDGRWTGGNYWNKTAPERIFKSQEIVVKENWEQTLDIKVTFEAPQKLLPLLEDKKDSQENKNKPNNIVPR